MLRRQQTSGCTVAFLVILPKATGLNNSRRAVTREFLSCGQKDGYPMQLAWFKSEQSLEYSQWSKYAKTLSRFRKGHLEGEVNVDLYTDILSYREVGWLSIECKRQEI